MPLVSAGNWRRNQSPAECARSRPQPGGNGDANRSVRNLPVAAGVAAGGKIGNPIALFVGVVGQAAVGADGYDRREFFGRGVEGGWDEWNEGDIKDEGGGGGALIVRLGLMAICPSVSPIYPPAQFLFRRPARPSPDHDGSEFRPGPKDVSRMWPWTIIHALEANHPNASGQQRPDFDRIIRARHQAHDPGDEQIGEGGVVVIPAAAGLAVDPLAGGFVQVFANIGFAVGVLTVDIGQKGIEVIAERDGSGLHNRASNWRGHPAFATWQRARRRRPIRNVHSHACGITDAAARRW